MDFVSCGNNTAKTIRSDTGTVFVLFKGFLKRYEIDYENRNQRFLFGSSTSNNEFNCCCRYLGEVAYLGGAIYGRKYCHVHFKQSVYKEKLYLVMYIRFKKTFPPV